MRERERERERERVYLKYIYIFLNAVLHRQMSENSREGRLTNKQTIDSDIYRGGLQVSGIIAVMQKKKI